MGEAKREAEEVLERIKEARRQGKGFYFKVIIDHKEEFTISQATVAVLAKRFPVT